MKHSDNYNPFEDFEAQEPTDASLEMADDFDSSFIPEECYENWPLAKKSYLHFNWHLLVDHCEFTMDKCGNVFNEHIYLDPLGLLKFRGTDHPQLTLDEWLESDRLRLQYPKVYRLLVQTILG